MSDTAYDLEKAAADGDIYWFVSQLKHARADIDRLGDHISEQGREIARLVTHKNALKEENKRLRKALEEMVQRYDAAEESSEIWDGPDYLGSYNMFQAECSEIIGIARSALKEE